MYLNLTERQMTMCIVRYKKQQHRNKHGYTWNANLHNSVKLEIKGFTTLKPATKMINDYVYLRCDKYLPVTWPDPSHPGTGHLENC